jgi:hypothetical protein
MDYLKWWRHIFSFRNHGLIWRRDPLQDHWVKLRKLPTRWNDIHTADRHREGFQITVRFVFTWINVLTGRKPVVRVRLVVRNIFPQFNIRVIAGSTETEETPNLSNWRFRAELALYKVKTKQQQKGVRQHLLDGKTSYGSIGNEYTLTGKVTVTDT